MGFRVVDQLKFKLPVDWGDYLFGKTALESFSFYPLVVFVLIIVFLISFLFFVFSRKSKRNRPKCKFFALAGKVFFSSFLLGAFILLSRWQTLGVFALRVFLLVWLTSVPLTLIALVVVYVLRFKADVNEASEKQDLSKYKPGRRKS